MEAQSGNQSDERRDHHLRDHIRTIGPDRRTRLGKSYAAALLDQRHACAQRCQASQSQRQQQRQAGHPRHQANQGGAQCSDARSGHKGL